MEFETTLQELSSSDSSEKQIKLANQDITLEHIDLIISYAPKIEPLTELYLENTKLDDTMFNRLVSETQKSLTKLTKQTLTQNLLTKESVSSLCQILTNGNTALEHLELDENNLGDEGVNEILPCLKGNSNLKCLSLKRNDISDICGEKLASILQENNILTHQGIDNNSCGDLTAEALATNLIKNKTLTNLTLKNCRITCLGAKSLAHALLENKTLRFLMLKENEFLGGGSRALAQVQFYREQCEEKDTFPKLLVFGSEQMIQILEDLYDDDEKTLEEIKQELLECKDVMQSNRTLDHTEIVHLPPPLSQMPKKSSFVSDLPMAGLVSKKSIKSTKNVSFAVKSESVNKGKKSVIMQAADLKFEKESKPDSQVEEDGKKVYKKLTGHPGDINAESKCCILF